MFYCPGRRPKIISPCSAKCTLRVPIGVSKVARPLTRKIWLPLSSVCKCVGVACFSSFSGRATVDTVSVATATLLFCLSRPIGIPSSRSDSSIRVVESG